MQVSKLLSVCVLAVAAADSLVSALEFDADGANFSNARVEADTFGASTTMTIATTEAADGGFDVGRTVDVNPATYAITTPCQAQSWTITHKSAVSIALEFADMVLPSGDQLVAVAANRKEIPVVPSPDGSETITEGVPGSTLTLQYRPSPTCTTQASFALTKLVVRETMVTKEAVCGANTLANVKCFANTGDAEDQKMYTLSSAVMRTQRVRDDGRIVVCTAWLWGNKGHIVTNNHCFSDQAMVDAAQFDFGVESSSCEATCTPGSCPIARAIKGHTGVKFIASDAKLDVALLQLTSATVAAEINAQYGYLQILFGMPSVGEEIYIPQHPGGGARQIAKTDDDKDVAIATIKATNAKVSVSNVLYTGLLGYAADTLSGSSGSPVISRGRNLVVGIHRIGYCNNAATPSKSMLGFLVPLAKGNDGLDA